MSSSKPLSSKSVPADVSWRERFHVRPVVFDDLPNMTWTGSPTHLGYVRRELERAEKGEVVYLAVCGPADMPLSVGLVDFARRPGSGDIQHVSTMPAVRSLGLGRILMEGLEDAIRARGVKRVTLHVEVDNKLALRLYIRLGYEITGQETIGWNQEAPDGHIFWYSTEAYVMARQLPPAPEPADETGNTPR